MTRHYSDVLLMCTVPRFLSFFLSFPFYAEVMEAWVHQEGLLCVTDVNIPSDKILMRIVGV